MHAMSSFGNGFVIIWEFRIIAITATLRVAVIRAHANQAHFVEGT